MLIGKFLMCCDSRLHCTGCESIIEGYPTTKGVAAHDKHYRHCSHTCASLTHCARSYPGDEKICYSLHAWVGGCRLAHQSFWVSSRYSPDTRISAVCVSACLTL